MTKSERDNSVSHFAELISVFCAREENQGYGKHPVQHRDAKNTLAFFWKDSYCRTHNVKP